MTNVVVRFTEPGSVSGNQNSIERFNDAYIKSNGCWLEVRRIMKWRNREGIVTTTTHEQIATFSQRYLVSAIVEHDNATE